MKKENIQLKKDKHLLQQKVWRLEKRESRKRKQVPSPELSPKSKVARLCQGKFLPSNSKDYLLRSLATEKELENSREAVGPSKNNKTLFSYFFSGKVLKKYRLLGTYQNILPLHSMRKQRKIQGDFTQGHCDPLKLCKRNPALVIEETKQSVRDFLLSDRASHFTPGKKSFIKVDGEKVQKKYLNDTLQELHKIYLSVSDRKVSYSTFCKYRPKNVVTPKLTERDTCLCKKCENFRLLVFAAQSEKLIVEGTPRELIKSIICSENATEECYFRKCKNCKGKKINFTCQKNSNSKIKFKEWATVKENVISKKTKQPITMKVTKRVEKTVSVKTAVNLLSSSLTEYMAHKQRAFHQSEEWDNLKDTMTDEDLLAVFDWSEKYSARCSEEIQSTHFGGSHKLISLHTGMIYTTQKEETFCTLSEWTEQGPKAILAHLKPILERSITEKTKYFHFKTDGPTTQYRNKFMFYLVGCELSKMFPQIQKIYWNFTEAGHGKSVADGTGGTIKRVLDSIIAHGGDIPDLRHIMMELSKKNLKTFILDIYEEDIRNLDSITFPNFGRFDGTMKVHQYVWDRKKPGLLKFKSLSCYKCNRFEGQLCSHFTLGKPFHLPMSSKNVSNRTRRHTRKKN